MSAASPHNLSCNGTRRLKLQLRRSRLIVNWRTLVWFMGRVGEGGGNLADERRFGGNACRPRKLVWRWTLFLQVNAVATTLRNGGLPRLHCD